MEGAGGISGHGEGKAWVRKTLYVENDVQGEKA